MKGWILVVLPVVGVVSWSLAARGVAREGQQALRPSVSWSGQFSAVKGPAYRRSTSGSEWMGLLQEHVGDSASPTTCEALRPAINFYDYMAVGIFPNKRVSKGGVYLASAVDEGRVIRLRFASMESGIRDQQDVTPYGIFVLPRSSKPIVIEEDTSRFRGQPVWEERRLPPGLGAK